MGANAPATRCSRNEANASQTFLDRGVQGEFDRGCPLSCLAALGLRRVLAELGRRCARGRIRSPGGWTGVPGRRAREPRGGWGRAPARRPRDELRWVSGLRRRSGQRDDGRQLLHEGLHERRRLRHRHRLRAGSGLVSAHQGVPEDLPREHGLLGHLRLSLRRRPRGDHMLVAVSAAEVSDRRRWTRRDRLGRPGHGVGRGLGRYDGLRWRDRFEHRHRLDDT